MRGWCLKDPIKLRYEVSKEDQIPILASWLSEPGILRWFPMVNQLEIEDACKVWIGYFAKTYGSSFTVWEGEEIVGFFNFYLSPVQKLRHQSLFSIIVHPRKRGQGIGTLMMKELKNKAKNEFGLSLLHLEVYRENPARKLYLAEGFEEYGVHVDFLKEEDGTYRDKILMQQWL